MSYTPKTWGTGDRVRTTDLNHIEQGIANAGSVATVRLSASGYDVGTKNFGYIVYAYFENGRWQFASDHLDDGEVLFGYEAPMKKVVVVLLPNDDTIGAFIVPTGASDMEDTGGVSGTATNVFFSYGSYLPCYRITGDGTAEFVY